MSIIRRNTALTVWNSRCCATDYVKCDNYASMPEIHYHEYYEIYILVNGQRQFFLSDRVLELKAGDVLITKALEPHKTVEITDSIYERYNIAVTPRFVKKMINKCPEFSDFLCTTNLHLSKGALAEVISLIEDINSEYKSQNSFSNVVVTNKLERMFIIFYKEKQLNESRDTVKQVDIRLRSVIEYIDENFKKPIDLKKCAEAAFMSESNLSRLFNKFLGVNLRTYINTKRVQEACKQLCETDKPIKEISEAVGYETASYFTLIFRESVNLSPKDYRKKMKNNNM